MRDDPAQQQSDRYPATARVLEDHIMQIIVNADDFGMDRDTLEATIACF